LGCDDEVGGDASNDASVASDTTVQDAPAAEGSPAPCMYTNCGDKCAQLDIDPDHCGNCWTRCDPLGDIADAGAQVSCSQGHCVLQCQGSATLCFPADASGVSTHCANLQTDTSDCGYCNARCDGTGGIPSCVGGKCSIACTGTNADCDGWVWNGCETDLAVDTKNCGQCKKDCAGGACRNGICQPALASNQKSPGSIAIDGTTVYWTTGDGAVRSCAKSGCNGNPTTLASAQSLPDGIATDGTSVFWVNDTSGDVQTCSVSGCGGVPTTMATGQSNPSNVAVRNGYAYWTTHAQNFAYLQKCAVTGCGGSPTKLTNDYGEVAVDDNNVYTVRNWVNRCAVGGCSMPTNLWMGVGYEIAIDGTSVYWTTSPGVVCNGACGKT
jgi:hypothetical protein